MYKILVVEDEWLTRDSLMNAIVWNKVDCEVVAGAKNGYEALVMMEELSPDIVLSDIKMDEMDGLELCKNVKERFPNIKVILITGYSEFEYAQKAVQLGVRDFILKPTDPDKLLEAVERVTKEIENNKLTQIEFARLQKIVEENIPALREKFFLELVNGKRFNPDEILQKREFLGISPADFYIVACEIDDYSEFLSKYDEKQKLVIKLMIRDIVENTLKFLSTGCFVEKDTNIFFIHMECTDVNSTSEYIQQKIADMTQISVSMGISSLTSGFENIIYAYEEAVEALKQKFYIGNNCIVSYPDLKRKVNPMLPFNYTNSIIDEIIEAVKVGNGEEAINKVEALFSEIAILKNESHIYIKNITFELIVLLHRFLLHLGEEPESIFRGLDYYKEISSCKNLQDIKKLLNSSMLKVAGLIYEKNKKLNESVIHKIIEYLHVNYFKDITLDELGKTVFMNPKYICRLIKKETGTNFSDILLEIRIEKAKILLRDPELKAFEIAQRVGINDSRYFSKVFKKSVGVTPTEYKLQL